MKNRTNFLSFLEFVVVDIPGSKFFVGTLEIAFGLFEFLAEFFGSLFQFLLFSFGFGTSSFFLFEFGLGLLEILFQTSGVRLVRHGLLVAFLALLLELLDFVRSEERRVGKECRSWWWADW